MPLICNLGQIHKSVIKAGIEDHLKNLQSTILIVDDEPDWQFNISTSLEDLNQNVFIAGNAHEALSLFEKIEEIDVVLLDIRMPEMSGDKLLPLLLEKSAKTKVIMVTAFDDVDIAISCIANGAYDYIQKPYAEHELIKKINRSIRDKHYPILLKNMVEKIKNQSLGLERRMAMFEAFCETRDYIEQQIRMEEIYVFFPECRNKDHSISNLTTLSPKMIFKEGIQTFVQRLLRV